MSAIKIINTLLNIFCLTTCFVILICLLTAEDRKTKLSRLLIRVVLYDTALLFFDLLAWVFRGEDGRYIYFVLRAAIYCVYSLGPILLIAFTKYISTYIAEKTRPTKSDTIITRIALAINYIDLILIAVAQFNGMYYIVDAENVYILQSQVWMTDIFSFICMTLNTILIIKYAGYLKKRELAFLLSYIVLPAVALGVQMIITDISFINYAITLTILIFYSGIQSEQSKQLKEKELELAKNREAIMLSQIQPHFLYNSLVAIKQLCATNPKLAEETVVEFSEYLRGNLDSLTINGLIPFDKELRHVKTYLAIEKKRFGDILNVDYDIRVQSFMLPALTLQVIVENAVRHGVTMREEGGRVIICAKETREDYILTVTDDGVGFNAEDDLNDGRSHVGISNVRNRLNSMCGGTLTVQSEQGIGTVAVLTIPK